VEFPEGEHMGEFPEGPRLELCVFLAIGPGSVPGQVTKIPKARVCGPKRKEKKKKKKNKKKKTNSKKKKKNYKKNLFKKA
jgi:hypothetical protein